MMVEISEDSVGGEEVTLSWLDLQNAFSINITSVWLFTSVN